MSSAVSPTPAAPAPAPRWSARRVPGRIYLTEPDYWRFLRTAERPHEWKCGLGLYDDSGAELGEVRPVDGYDEDGKPAMASAAHSRITLALLVLLDRVLRGQPFEPFDQPLAVRPASGRNRYPDAMVAVDPATFEPHPEGKQLVLTNPAVLFEALSDSTEAEDLTVKLNDYATIPSVTDYVILAQDEPLALHYRRPAGASAADGWHVTRHAGLDATVALDDPPARPAAGGDLRPRLPRRRVTGGPAA